MSSPLDPYPSPEQRDARVERLAHRLGAELIDYGASRQGRRLWAVRVPPTRPTRERVMCTANIHGVEFVGGQVALGVLDALETAPLRRRAEIWVLPCLNPDGYATTYARAGRGSVAELRPNAAGVDLNRNFPLPRGARRLPLPGAGSSTPGAATYYGPHPLSEPESRHLDELAGRHPMRASIDLHSFMGTIIPARVVDRPSFARYCQLARAIQAAQRRPYRRLSSRWFDAFTGELEDHLHHEHGMWAVCLETFALRATLAQHLRPPSTFWRFNPHTLAAWVEHDVPAVLAFLNAALDLPRPGEAYSAHGRAALSNRG